jgi:hypothetical protein
MANNLKLKNVLVRLHREIGLTYRLGASFQEENQDQGREVWSERLSRESAARNNVDLVCRYWIEHGIWPQMDEETRVWASDRLAEAYLTAGFLAQEAFVVESKTENEILDFLLVKWWKNMVLRRVHMRSMTNGKNSFCIQDAEFE